MFKQKSESETNRLAGKFHQTFKIELACSTVSSKNQRRNISETLSRVLPFNQKYYKKTMDKYFSEIKVQIS